MSEDPLAPFQDCEPHQLAALAVLLSKGKDPANHLPAAASLWAQAYDYREHLRYLFGGEDYEKIARFSLPVWSLGANDSLSLREACAKYSWGQRHLHELLKDNVPPHILKLIWKPPVNSIRLPRILLERLEKLQSQKRIDRAHKGVKRRRGG